MAEQPEEKPARVYKTPENVRRKYAAYQQRNLDLERCKCNLCGKLFKDPTTLAIHKRGVQHHPHISTMHDYTCILCGVSSNRPSLIRYHLKTKRHLRAELAHPEVQPINYVTSKLAHVPYTRELQRDA